MDRKEARALISFETRPIEDQTASRAAGHAVYRDVDYAIVMPAGNGSLVLDQEVNEFRLQQWERKEETRYRAEAYRYWKKGQEIPVDGTPLKMWPQITPAQIKACESANIRTVEDLALINESGLARIGMGGRKLKDAAAQWLKTANDVGKASAEITGLRAELSDSVDRIRELEGVIRQMQTELAERPRRGRPPKDEAA